MKPVTLAIRALVYEFTVAEAIATVSLVDRYCAAYQHLFPEVRSFECFKFLHLGMISEIKRKSLPAMPGLWD